MRGVAWSPSIPTSGPGTDDKAGRLPSPRGATAAARRPAPRRGRRPSWRHARARVAVAGGEPEVRTRPGGVGRDGPAQRRCGTVQRQPQAGVLGARTVIAPDRTVATRVIRPDRPAWPSPRAGRPGCATRSTASGRPRVVRRGRSSRPGFRGVSGPRRRARQVERDSGSRDVLGAGRATGDAPGRPGRELGVVWSRGPPWDVDRERSAGYEAEEPPGSGVHVGAEPPAGVHAVPDAGAPMSVPSSATSDAERGAPWGTVHPQAVERGTELFVTTVMDRRAEVHADRQAWRSARRCPQPGPAWPGPPSEGVYSGDGSGAAGGVDRELTVRGRQDRPAGR